MEKTLNRKPMFNRKQILRQLNQIFKLIVCLLICFMLIFGTCYHTPVHAAAIGLIVGGAVLVAAALTALGIGVAATMSNVDYNTECQEIWDNLSEDVQAHVTYGVAAGEVVANYTYDSLKQIFNSAETIIPQKVDPLSPGYTVSDSSFGALFGYPSIGMGFAPTAIMSTAMIVNVYSSDQIHSMLTSENNYTFSISVDNHDINVMTNIGLTTIDGVSQSSQHFGLNLNFSLYVVGYKQTATSAWSYGLVQVRSAIASSTNWLSVSSLSQNVPYIPQQDIFMPSSEKFYADGASVMNQPVDDVIDKIKQKVGTADGVDVNVGDAVGSKESVDDDTKANTQEKALGRDIATDVDKDADKDTNKDRDTTAPKSSTIPDLTIPEMITKKFPFSIPWDLYNSVTILSATGKAPVFDIPFKASVVGVNTSIHIDLSIFDPVAAVARWGLSLLFLIALIILTGRLIKH
jgi:hypothetical protein